MDEPARRAFRHLPPTVLAEMIDELPQETKVRAFEAICRTESFKRWFEAVFSYDIDIDNQEIW